MDENIPKEKTIEQGQYDSHYLQHQSRDMSLSTNTIWEKFNRTFYDYSDLRMIQESFLLRPTYIAGLKSIDELLDRDRQREEDGFPRKIRIGKLVKPGRGGK
jgi:hypothetical protein